MQGQVCTPAHSLRPCNAAIGRPTCLVEWWEDRHNACKNETAYRHCSLSPPARSHCSSAVRGITWQPAGSTHFLLTGSCLYTSVLSSLPAHASVRAPLAMCSHHPCCIPAHSHTLLCQTALMACTLARQRQHPQEACPLAGSHARGSQQQRAGNVPWGGDTRVLMCRQAMVPSGEQCAAWEKLDMPTPRQFYFFCKPRHRGFICP